VLPVLYHGDGALEAMIQFADKKLHIKTSVRKKCVDLPLAASECVYTYMNLRDIAGDRANLSASIRALASGLPQYQKTRSLLACKEGISANEIAAECVFVRLARV
jgi:hypothetical protein